MEEDDCNNVKLHARTHTHTHTKQQVACNTTIHTQPAGRFTLAQMMIVMIIVSCNFMRQKCNQEMEAEKILQYKDLTIQTECTWDVKVKVIPVITGAT
jgi:hypothetical protein